MMVQHGEGRMMTRLIPKIFYSRMADERVIFRQW